MKNAEIWVKRPFVSNATRIALVVLMAVAVVSSLLNVLPSRAQAASVTHTFEGYVDLVDCTRIAGWAWDSTQPNTPINVDIYDGEVFVASFQANILRQDLVDAGKGNGAHGFDIPTPDVFKDGNAHTVRVKFANSNIELNGSPQSLDCSPQYEGYIDVANCNEIVGWAWDAKQPNTPIYVDVYFDNNPFRSMIVPANKFRQDVLNAGKGNGFHGFVFPTPSRLKDGTPHTIRLKFSGTTIDLVNSPRTINCSPDPPEPDYEGYFETANCDTLVGWAWDANQPNTPINVDIYDGPVLLATIPANQFRQDLFDAGKGNGAHGFTFAVPMSLKDGQMHTVSIGFGGSKYGLTGTPKTIDCSVQGWLDISNCNKIAGWAWDSDQPNTPINVEILSDGVVIAIVSANEFRQDLLDAGIGNGAHGFTLTTPFSLKNGQPHLIRARFAGTESDLNGSGQSINCPSDPNPPDFEGYLDIANCTRIAGWAWNKNQPNTPIKVEIYDDNVLIATITADQFRQDLLDAGKGNGAHAFDIALPAFLKDGQPHTIRMKFAGSQTEASSSPKFITCPGP